MKPTKVNYAYRSVVNISWFSEHQSEFVNTQSGALGSINWHRRVCRGMVYLETKYCASRSVYESD